MTRTELPTYRIEPSSSLGAELHRVATAQLEQAVATISPPLEDPAKAVHECRKTIKRLRALAQLGSMEKGSACRALDRKCRNAGRHLAFARDATVIRTALQTLIAEGEDGARFDLDHEISADTDAPEAAAAAAKARLAHAANLLPACFGDHGDWNLARLATAIGATYERARSDRDRFKADKSDALAHAWRKSTQRLMNQMHLIAPFNRKLVKRRLKSLHRLADVLGSHQDLSILVTRLESMPQGERRSAELRHAARAQQKQLARRALRNGAKPFADSGAAFVANLFLSTKSHSSPKGGSHDD